MRILKDNTGSSMVLVIVAMAFVGILGATILWMSLNNYQMKVTDSKQTKSFYSAETVMEQIIAGLQKDASEAVRISYGYVLQNYSVWPEDKRLYEFKMRYLQEVTDSVALTGDPTKYDMAKLISYVDEALLDEAGIGRVRRLTSTNCKLTQYATYISLEDLHLVFEDEKGQTSIINTDIVLATPDIKFTQSATMPDIFKYALIANNSLYDSTTAGVVKINGSIYGGKKGIFINNDWTIQQASKIVTDKDISLVAANSKLTMGGATTEDVPTVWAESINIDSGKLDSHAIVYLADDLTIGGTTNSLPDAVTGLPLSTGPSKGIVVNLENEFYGYGNSNLDKAKSSAIIINGIDSTLDMSKLDKLLVAGHSYIGTSRAVEAIDPTVSGNAPFVDNKDILMGESIAVKGNQIAYLVPDECIGVLDGVTVYGKNPMTADEYQHLLEDIERYKNLIPPEGEDPQVFEEIAYTKTLSGRIKSLSDYTSEVQKVFVPCNGETLVYYYLVMSEDSANDYFKEYYGLKKEKLDRYFDIYTSDAGIKVNTNFARISTQGNWMVSATAPVDPTDKAEVREAEKLASAQLALEISKYQEMYKALKTKLIPDYYQLKADELAKADVFKNVIKVADMDAFTAANGGNCTFDIDGLKAVITSGDYSYSSSDKVRLIVAKGDVKVSNNYTGLIIANGDIEIEDGVTIDSATSTISKAELTKVLQAYFVPGDTTSKRPIDFFTDGSQYIIDGTLTGDPGDEELEDNAIDFTQIVRYENWLKQ